MACMTVSSSANAVRMMTFTGGANLCRRRHTSKPLPSGSCASISTMSGLRRSTTSKAPVTVPESPTTSTSLRWFKSARKPARTTGPSTSTSLIRFKHKAMLVAALGSMIAFRVQRDRSASHSATGVLGFDCQRKPGRSDIGFSPSRTFDVLTDSLTTRKLSPGNQPCSISMTATTKRAEP